VQHWARFSFELHCVARSPNGPQNQLVDPPELVGMPTQLHRAPPPAFHL
jgi:hypothetical protein